MIKDEYLVESFERTSLNFQNFSEDMASAASIIGKMAEARGISGELQMLFIHLNKLSLSYFEFRKEYLKLAKESLSSDELKSMLETAIEDNYEAIADAKAEIKRFS